MEFNDHSKLRGSHSLLSASNYYWINDTDEKFVNRVRSFYAAEQGTKDHDFAALCISRHQLLPSRPKTTLAMYVNDAIGYRMTPECVLRYSDLSYVTADAIAFDERKKILRISDLKTGVTPASMNQLLVYTAYFCLEYHKKPIDISTELRIYQSNEIIYKEPEVDEIVPIMDKIVRFTKILEAIKAEEE